MNQSSMFDHQDTPLFSGTPTKALESVFTPRPAPPQQLCLHLEVDAYYHTIRSGSYYEPDDVTGYVTCVNCHERFELDDMPPGAEIRREERY